MEFLSDLVFSKLSFCTWYQSFFLLGFRQLALEAGDLCSIKELIFLGGVSLGAFLAVWDMGWQS
jgi:hypothetical protein